MAVDLADRWRRWSGGTLAAGGANAINCYLDRDIDEIMHRTQGRPLPLGKIEPASALVFALALGGAGVRAAAGDVEPAGGDAGAVGDGVLRVRLHDVAEADDAAEHRHRRRGRRVPAAGRVGGGDGQRSSCRRSCCSRSSSSGRRRTSGRWRSSTRTTTRARTCRCCRWWRRWRARSRRSSGTRWRWCRCRSPCGSPGAVGWIYVASAAVLGVMFVREAWRLRRDEATAMSVFRTSIYYLALIFFAVAADTLILS